jgi:NDP-sugar pyrophosphorylase family protein
MIYTPNCAPKNGGGWKCTSDRFLPGWFCGGLRYALLSDDPKHAADCLGVGRMTCQALILAGGQGTRLRPYTTVFPKALVPLGDMPVLELVLRQLKQAGVTDVLIAVGHLAGLIQAFFGDGSRLGLRIAYGVEDTPLGTAGPIRAHANQLADDFWVMNADVVSSIDLAALMAHHQQAQAPATIAVYHRPTAIDFGVLNLEGGHVHSFVEKPLIHHWVSMGVYAFNKRVVDFIPPAQFFGFDHLMQALLNAQAPISAFPFDGYWMDIGRVEDYETAVNDFHTHRGLLLPGALG